MLENGNISLIGGKDGEGKMLNIHEFDIQETQLNFLTNDGEFLERSGFAGVQSRGNFSIIFRLLFCNRRECGWVYSGRCELS